MDTKILLVSIVFFLASVCEVDAFLGQLFRKTKENILKKNHKQHDHSKTRARMGNFSTEYILQPLDHFDLVLDDQKMPVRFNQRYYVNDGNWNKTDGPVFLFIGGESALDELEILTGHTVDMAKKFGGLLFGVEHRFYGESINFDGGLKMNQLKYLNSQQALADLASFHGHAVKKFGLTDKNKWMCFGGSYPGALSAWFRLKYPHLVHAAVASSAPVRAQVNFEAYNEVVTASFANHFVGGSQECTESIRQVFQMVKTKSWDALQEDFNTCTDITTQKDYKLFITQLTGVFMGVAQYNRVIDSARHTIIDLVCKQMTSSSSPYHTLAELSQEMMEGCLYTSYDDLITTLSSTFYKPGELDRQWIYQTCQQFGYYQTCDVNTTCMFLPELDLDFNLELCQTLYGLNRTSIYKNIDFTNLYYGADKPDGARILFVNGDIDPWHALSITENLSPDMVAVFIKGASHCQDMDEPMTTRDSPELQNGRELIKNQVFKWLFS